jgi:signal transduction histidine kinase
MCSVYYGPEPEGLRYLATAHRDPAVEARTARVIAEEGMPRRVVEVARGGKTLFIPDAGDDIVRETRGEEHKAFRASLGMRSSVLLPLVARGHVLGVITVSTLHGGRRMQAVDVAFLEDLASRAALAVDNARLYTQAQAGRVGAEEANERLRDLDRMKTQFINTVSHELRTPLTPLELQLELLRMRPHDERTQRAVDIIGRNVRRLTELVSDLGDVARLQSGKLAVKRVPMDLAQAAREAVESFEEPARQAGIKLSLHAPAGLAVQADPQRMTQVLYNLLTNAMKFTPKGGRIEVEVQARPGAAEVRVRDTGVGLTREQQARLFQPFSQVHETMHRTRSGTGLGLYICKGLVEQHQGTMGVESAGPGKGSTFWFRVPAGPA